MSFYVLDENDEPQPIDDAVVWGRWFETAERHVAKTKIGKTTVSTVFLGLDHSFGRSRPMLYETMIFGGVHDQYQERYATKSEALAGHGRAVELVKKGQP